MFVNMRWLKPQGIGWVHAWLPSRSAMAARWPSPEGRVSLSKCIFPLTPPTAVSPANSNKIALSRNCCEPPGRTSRRGYKSGFCFTFSCHLQPPFLPVLRIIRKLNHSLGYYSRHGCVCKHERRAVHAEEDTVQINENPDPQER